MNTQQTPTKTYRIANRHIPYFVHHKLPFKANSTRGDWYDMMPDTGYLPTEYREMLKLAVQDALNKDEKLYIVHSYNTPIGWYSPVFGWQVPRVKYSQTTSCAQGRVNIGATDDVTDSYYDWTVRDLKAKGVL